MKHCNWKGCAAILSGFKYLLYGDFEQNWPNPARSQWNFCLLVKQSQMVEEMLAHKGEYPIILALGFVLAATQLTHNLQSTFNFFF